MSGLRADDTPLAEVEAWLDGLPNTLRLGAAAGCTRITLNALGSIRMAKRLERRNPPAPLIVQIAPAQPFADWWLRLMAILLLTDACWRAGRSIAQWITAAL